MNPSAMIFFFIFVLILVGAYLFIRRQIAPPAIVAGAGVVGSIIAMTLFSLAQENIFFHALIVGVVVGGGISLIMLGLAWYFQGNELRQTMKQNQSIATE